MDFLNKSFQQLTELFRSMTPAARITSGILLVAIAVSMIYLFQFQMSGGEAYLYGNREFSAEEVGQMEGAFGNSGLNDYEVVGNRIRVPRSERDQYYKALADNSAIPYSIQRDKETSSLSNPFLSNAALNKHDKAAKTEKLQRTIAELPKIANAYVQWDEHRVNPPFANMQKTCTVSVKPVGSHALTGEEFRAVSNIVRGALSGIRAEDIHITDLNSGEAWTGEEIAASESENELSREKKNAESDYRDKIRAALVDYHGSRVQVDVTLDPTARTTTWSKQVEAGTPIRTSSEKENTKSTTGGNGGAPGVRSNNNTATANGAASIAATRQNSSDSQKEMTENIAGGTLTSRVEAGYKVLKVEASIGIPQDYVEKLYLYFNPPADGEEKVIPIADLRNFFETSIEKDIADLIRPLLPAPTTLEDPYEQIVIRMTPSVDLDPAPSPDYTGYLLTWLDANWQNLGLMGFGLFAVVMLKSMVGTATKDLDAADTVEREFGSLLPAEDDDDSDEIEEVIIDENGQKRIVRRKRIEVEEEKVEKANQLLERFQNREPTLRDELVELVESDLDAAAEVLRSWIGDRV